MTGPAADLEDLLHAEAVELRALLGLLRDEGEAIVHGHAAALLGLHQRQRPVMDRLARLERVRRGLVAALAENLGVPERDVTLRRLVTLLPDSPAALVRLRGELGTLVGEVAAASRRNRFLAERSLGYTRRLLDLLLGTLGVAAAPTYGGTGRAARAMAGLGLVDREA